MKTVTVSKAELLAKLKTNLAAHTADYAEASARFREGLLAELDVRRKKIAEELDRIQQTFSQPDAKPVLPVADHGLLYFGNLAVPASHVADYQRAIEMLEMSVNDEVTLDASEFRQFVRDEWSWKEEYNTVSAMSKKRVISYGEKMF